MEFEKKIGMTREELQSRQKEYLDHRNYVQPDLTGVEDVEMAVWREHDINNREIDLPENEKREIARNLILSARNDPAKAIVNRRIKHKLMTLPLGSYSVSLAAFHIH